ncbi:hypothetical protein [Wolbachia endosymbiont of Ctenocephalides felis wCfeT]|uniref:hypothetical protein n=1 Tax=Wolbachia endosymbiont of Ctenocephalides felis wCfeT TaxID=2732593 RepID=UPI001447BF7C|nr:hypothetical protein [Wolbachia endosymbiont of Ctenocephalides felis wCfeT]
MSTLYFTARLNGYNFIVLDLETKEVKSFSKPTGYCFLSHTPEWILEKKWHNLRPLLFNISAYKDG